ncbi:SLBB domain-containing protein [Sunxiuqinia sp. A32]
MTKIVFFISLLIIGIKGLSQNVNSVNIQNTSDEQIEQVLKEIKNQGLSMDQAISLAKAKGASQFQINQLINRIQQLKTFHPTSSEQSDLLFEKKDTTLIADTLKKEEVHVTELNKRIFGYQLFNSESLSFEPNINIPTPQNYTLGIGDQLQINVWGASQQTYLLTVDNNGTINIPDLGQIFVSGQNFKDARQLILNRLTGIYSDMRGSSPGTFADVSIQNLHSITINVIGEVIAPGTYTLPATASAFNALYLSNGPNENGSFRNIKLIRDNKSKAKIDVYDYLINGNAAANITLRDQDILIVPPYEKRVKLGGGFKRKGIFELKEDETLQQLIDYAGGFSENAYKNQLSITRFANGQMQLADVSKENYEGFLLQNGDSIFAGKVIDRFENRINISGAVFRPGDYSLTENTTLADLIQKAGGIREDHYANRGLIIRLDEQLYPTSIPFEVDDVVAGKMNIPLKREDQVIIRDIFSIGEQAFVNILGEVMFPGKFDFMKNMTLKDVIFLAGGLTEAASESFIEVARRNKPDEAQEINDKMVSLYQFHIDRNLKLDPEDQKFTLQAFDYIYIRKAPSYHTQKTVSVTGEVKYPGEYSISSKTERISDIISRAGGLTPYAFSPGASLNRNTEKDIKQNIEYIQMMEQDEDSLIWMEEKINVSRLELRLDEILAKPGSIYDYILNEGDEVYIPKKSDEIWITGEVLNPIGLAWQKGKKLKYYINRAGGFSDNAKKGKLYIIYSDGTTRVTKKVPFKKFPIPQPGSQIVVPMKPVKPDGDNTGKWLAITSALSSLAVAIAAVLR